VGIQSDNRNWSDKAPVKSKPKRNWHTSDPLRRRCATLKRGPLAVGIQSDNRNWSNKAPVKSKPNRNVAH
jgi:hypothetical protein